MRQLARPYRVAIIGAGFSGLCLGIQLKKAGIPFTILEKSDGVGGTWRDNTYPGAACDVPSFLYCFSFEQKTDWSRKWSPQPEILAYMEHCAEKYALGPHIRFGTEVVSADYDDERSRWRIALRDGGSLEAEILISGTGQLNRPWVPPIAGLESFEGPSFHSARWDHEVSLEGKRVAVIGNAASAIQFIPQIAPRVAHLDVYQRSANWMMPRKDRAYREAEQRRFARHPWLARLYRWWIWAMFDLRWPMFRGSRFLSERFEPLAIAEMRKVVEDPALQEALIPKYPVGGKRALISDDYYATLNRENVGVVLERIDRVEADGLVTADGVHHPADVLILATGFDSTSFLAPIEIRGRDGLRLHDVWAEGAEAHLGLAVSGFPNFFMTYGPNTNLGHNSIIFMIECQTQYILDCLRQMEDRRLRSIEVRPEVQRAFNERLQRELARTVWAAPDRSWYKNDAGKITNNWSGPTLRYWWQTRRAELREYLQLPAVRALRPDRLRAREADRAAS